MIGDLPAGEGESRLYHYGGGVYGFECPGCGYGHSVHTRHPNESGATWHWNESMRHPTFTPSLLVFPNQPHPPEDGSYPRCHSFVTDGKIQFLSDCGHALAGQTVDLPIVDNNPDP